jgi:hypothetical protein
MSPGQSPFFCNLTTEYLSFCTESSGDNPYQEARPAKDPLSRYPAQLRLPAAEERRQSEADSYYYKAVLWAVENGITAGTSAITFSPSQTCNRSEILTFIYRALDSPACNRGNPFSDVKDGKWYAQTAAWAFDNHIELGEHGAFNPKTPCTRASTILYIYRALEHKALAAETP